MHEIETKVLEIDIADVSKKLEQLGAKKTDEVLLKVDWFSLPGIDKDKQPWFLRVRSYSTGKAEITWKADPKVIGTVRQAKEINVIVDDHEKTKLLFESIGLVVYAHQEKKRTSWNLDNVQFDLDVYPNMPGFLEIEGNNEEEINSMASKLGVDKYERWNDGERTLIEQKYKLNWCEMRF